MAKRRIRPKDRRNKGERIKPGSSRGVSPQTLPPKFSLRYLSQREHSLRNCQRDEKAAFADTLDKLSRLTWNRIASSNRHANGYEKIPRAQIKASIPQHITDEVNLLAFRFFGRRPMVGYRDGTTFYVLWLDRDFTLYSHA